MKVPFRDTHHPTRLIVFNKRTYVVEEFIHVIFDEPNDLSSRKEDIANDDVGILDKTMKKLSIKDTLAHDDKEDNKEADGKEESNENDQDKSLPKK